MATYLRSLVCILAIFAGGGVLHGDEPPEGEPPAAAPAAGDVLRLSLQEAVRMGIAANLNVQESSYNTPIALQGRVAAEASFDTLLTAGFTASHTETPVSSVFQGNDPAVENVVTGQVGASRSLRTGGTISLLYRADRISTNNPFSTVNPAYTAGLALEASQPLLRGAGDVAIADIRRAQNDVAAARAGFETQVEATLLAIVESYWELVFADVNLDALQKSEEVARELLDDANSRLAAEVGTPLDVAEARAGVERRRSEVLEAENLRETLQDQLLSLIMPFGQEARHDVRVEPTDGADVEPERLPGPDEERRYVDLALQGRPEIRSSKAEISTRGIDTVVARDAIRPQLDVMGRIATDGLSRGVGGTWEDLYTGRAVSGSVGLEFSLFLGQRAARANWLAAAWARRQAVLRLRELENQIIVEVRSALRDLETAKGQREAARSEVAAAEEALAGERQRLANDKSTPFRILQKEEDLTAARTRLGRAGADLRIAVGRLWKSVGSLTANLGVNARRWAPCPTCR
jgi:outer membrane protein TolC